VSACGSEKDQGTIPQDQGNAVLEQLETVQAQLDAGDCDGAEATAIDIQETLANIGQEVSEELEAALVEASGNLTDQTRTQCEPVEEPPPPVEPTGATGEEGSEDDG